MDWLVGPNQRNMGSLHQDEWQADGITLARTSHLAVFPVGGWWKYQKAQDRTSHPIRYALVVSLRTRADGIDLYTPIANELQIPVSAT